MIECILEKLKKWQSLITLITANASQVQYQAENVCMNPSRDFFPEDSSRAFLNVSHSGWVSRVSWNCSLILRSLQLQAMAPDLVNLPRTSGLTSWLRDTSPYLAPLSSILTWPVLRCLITFNSPCPLSSHTSSSFTDSRAFCLQTIFSSLGLSYKTSALNYAF